ncbi:hypothetical protein IW262DRAFT_1344153 [Armillaria fumosa]|nr:hypothetical protein IW262DRAFT_1344153 [Armillaria fumosa]
MSNQIDEAINNSWIWDVELFPEHQQTIYLPAYAFRLHIVAHRNEDDSHEQGRPPGNHWLFYVEVYTGDETVKRSVHFSVRSGYDSTQPGTIHLACLPYAVTSDRSHVLSFYFTQRITIREIIVFMIQGHLDCYRFTDNHEGCTYWTSVVVRRFTEQGWLPAQLSQELDTAIQFYYPDHLSNNTVSQPAPISKAHFEGLIKGTFFVPTQS